MSNSQSRASLRLIQTEGAVQENDPVSNPRTVPVGFDRGNERVLDSDQNPVRDRLLTAKQVAERLNVTTDWVWDHSSRKAPHLPVIRMGDGTLRYRASRIEEFINERERLTRLRRRA